VSTREYEIVIRRDSTIPAGRARALKRMTAILSHFPNGVPDRANCFFHGLTKGWVLSDVIGHADADEVEELLQERPVDVLRAIPYGPEDVDDPEFDSLTEDDIPTVYGFSTGWASKRACTSSGKIIRKCPSGRCSRGLAFCSGSSRAAHLDG
jgi:hypothetical protein